MSQSNALLSILSANNSEYIANLYREFLKSPASVDGSWRVFFDALRDDEAALLSEIAGASWGAKEFKKPNAPFGVTTADDVLKAGKSPANQSAKTGSAPAADPHLVSDSVKALMLIKAYRAYGHFAATLDPLGLKQPKYRADLDVNSYGFSSPNAPVFLGGILGYTQTTVSELHARLKSIYAGKVGIEIDHLLNPKEVEWLRAKIEGQNQFALSADEKKNIYSQLVAAQGLEDFLHTKYTGAKRFGLDGSESYIPCLEEIIRRGAELGLKEVAVGMAHRGRLNTLTNVLGKPFTKLFAEFNGMPSAPDDTPGSGDVKYHMGYSNDREISGQSVHLTLTPNPSHLEVVNPVVAGKVRAKQDMRGDTETRRSVLTFTVHGDSAFAGQGTVAEILMMAELPGYTVGGTMHVIINNQIGFTTLPDFTRSGPYSSDIAKMIYVPIFHVNGDDVEEVVRISRLAIEYRQEFGRDVVIDLIGYRKNGHNEGDEPMFTQPVMYKKIKDHPSVRTQYAQKLIGEGVLDEAAAEKTVADFMAKMNDAFEATKSYKVNKADWLEGAWNGLTTAYKSRFGAARKGETAITPAMVQLLGEKLTHVPADFALNTKIARQFDAKKEMFKTGAGFDWGTAEAMAFGSLLLDGFNVRLSGEDAGRGTFSHRHATLHDQNNMNRYYPLANLGADQANFEVHDSPLSELAVLGYEYGYSWAAPNSLVLWEGQFGDFVNGAQMIIDQYIASAETKWLRMSGLVMLLPHGSEGQGPEHSSARPERFLQLCAEDNWQITNITTPANYFHALRRQMCRDFRKPLINMSPKSLLRHKLCVSKTEDFTGQTTFHRYLWDDAWNTLEKPKSIKRVILCSGKVYYDLFEEREKRGIKNILLLRLEQFYPFPHDELAKELAQYTGADFVWVQEEPKNQGGWSFVEPLLEDTLAEAGFKGKRFKFTGRPSAAAPATGYMKRHQEEQAKLLDEALKL